MSQSKIRLLITGASGFIGTNAVDAALKQGFEVLNFDIKPPQKQSHQKLWREVDIRDYLLLKQELTDFNPTHILHLAATTGMDVYDLDFFLSNTLGVKNLIEICKELPGLQRTLFISSLLVCENGYIPKHDTDYCPPNLYGKSKMIGEQLVRSEGTNLDWVIIRPTSVWGPWFEHSYKAFFKTIDRNLYFHLGNTSIVKPITFVGNAVHMMFQLLFGENKEAISQKSFYLGDYPEHSTQEWANLIQKNMGVAPIKTMPVPLLRGAAMIGDLLKNLGWPDPPLTSFRINNMLTGAHYPLEPTEAVVGKLPFSLEDGVRQTIDWMYEHNHIKHKNVPL